MSVKVKGIRPTIPVYYRDFINPEVDLTQQPKQCCPFHKEDTPSFSYSAEKGVWRCFGACHTGGDVIDLHRMNYRLSSREEAEKSLNAIYEIKPSKRMITDVDSYLDYVNQDRVEDNTIYVKALRIANTVDRWIELDYVMSKYPVEISDIRSLVEKWEEESYERDN